MSNFAIVVFGAVTVVVIVSIFCAIILFNLDKGNDA